MADTAAIVAAVSCYTAGEYPALAAQIREWEVSRPLAGLRLLDATPLFRNTLVKHLALLAAGAELTAGYSGGIPYDPAAVEILQKSGVPCRLNGTPAGSGEHPFDIIFDCGGVNRNLTAIYGTVELTRSGAHYYRDSTSRIFLVDAGKVKLIETALGTGDGLVRGLQANNIEISRNTEIIIFGAGKVGRGILANLLAWGCKCTIVDAPECLNALPPEVRRVSRFDHDAVNSSVLSSRILVTATGVAGALRSCRDLTAWAKEDIIFANMGVEDEFGPDIPASRVLNNKEPLNFILPEPTLLRYIDPAMALSNAGAAALLSGSLHPGLNIPDLALEDKILADVRRNGIINAEITRWEAMNIYE